MGIFDKFKDALGRSREALAKAFDALRPGEKLGPEALEALEAALLGSDLGPALAQELVDRVRRAGADLEAGKSAARALLLERLTHGQGADGDVLRRAAKGKPEVTLMLGVNGSGKTTTSGKLAWHFRRRGEKVLLGAADTFRAAAADQLALWAQRSGAELLRQAEGADPAAVAFDAVSKGLSGGFDRVLIDTAGRLQTKSNLMEELKKVHRVAVKALAGGPVQVLLVLDGTSGQNMVSQARLFHEAVPLDGLVVTKLDGTAKAGALLQVQQEVKVPVQLLGLGEGPEDLREYEREAFARALLP
jgi:fused signal recognition particle receptor